MLLVLAAVALAGRWKQRWGRLAIDLAAMLALAIGVALLAWPAARADPLGTLAQILTFSESKALEPHEHGSFFLGQPVADPGPAFYPVVLAFRLSPLVLAGLALLALRAVRHPLRPGRPLGPWAADLAALLACAALAVLVVTLGAKKLDRYALPAVPLLAVVAGVGLQRALKALPLGASGSGLVLGAMGLAQLALCAGARPYYFTYYSPLLGGATLARTILPVGWGEGVDRVASYLNGRPGKEARSVLAPDAVRVTLRAQTRAKVVDPEERQDTDYRLSYVSAAQRNEDIAARAGVAPVLTVRIDGVDYARLYQSGG
jgi:hypothetical protein